MKIKMAIYYILSSLILLGILVFGVFCLRPIFIRSGQVVIEFGTSIGFYFQEIFDAEWGINFDVSSNNNYFKGFSLDLIPDEPEMFFRSLGLVFLNLFNKDFFERCIYDLSQNGKFLTLFITTILILFLLLRLILRNYLEDDSKKAGNVSKPLLAFDKFVDVFNICIDNVHEFIWFFFNSFFKIIFIIEILYFTNLINAFVYLISVYFYFCASFNVVSIYYLIKKILIDISFLFKKEWIWFWIILGYVVLKSLFNKIALKRIHKYHVKDICFVNDLGLLTLITGTMAKGKTTCMTDMGLNMESIYREVALDKMTKLSLEFPEIDFRIFEINLDQAFKEHRIFNLYSCKEWIYENIDEYYLEYSYFDGLKEISLYDIYYNYAQLYWLYTSPTSYIISNYAVRSGLMIYSDKHLMRWTDDFFSSSVDNYYNSNFSHIIDYNNFRPLKKVDNRLEWSSSIDIGVFLNDEIGKERLNKNELEDVKKNDSIANQKNDGLNVSLKLARHQSTIDHYPFFKWIGAEQRSQSVPADYRELNDVILNMSSEMKEKNCYPMYFIIDWFLSLIEGILMNSFLEFRHNRDDLTLLFQLTKNILSWVIKTRKYFDHKYGVKVVYFDVLDGSEKHIGDKKYYLIKQKIYSSRFATDAYAGINEKRYSSSSFGLNDIETYECEKASEDEFKKQNSYLMNDLFSVKKKVVQKDKQKGFLWKPIDKGGKK